MDASNTDEIFDLLVGKKFEYIKEEAGRKNVTSEIEFREHNEKINIKIKNKKRSKSIYFIYYFIIIIKIYVI